MASLLGSAVSAAASSLSISASLGASRMLVAFVTQEGALTLNPPSGATWGGRTMTYIGGAATTSGFGCRVDLYVLLEADISLGIGSTLSVSGMVAEGTISAQFVESVSQTTTLTTDSAFSNAATPNPETGISLTVAMSELLLVGASCGNPTTSSWTNATELTDQADSSSTGTMAWAAGTGAAINPQCTFASQNRRADFAVVLPNAGITISDVETDETFSDGDTAVTVTGIDFGESQGTGNVYLSTDDSLGDSNEVQTVTSWSDTSIDFTAVLGDLPPGSLYLVVENDSTDTAAALVTVYRKQEIKLSASTNIAASGEDTTERMSVPVGYTTGTDFSAGRIQDDENPADSVNHGTDKFTEYEWAIEGTSNAQCWIRYEFQIVLSDGTAIPVSVTPEVEFIELFDDTGWAGYFEITSQNAQVPGSVYDGAVDLGEHAPTEFWSAVTDKDVRVTDSTGSIAYPLEYTGDYDASSSQGWLFFRIPDGLPTGSNETFRVYGGHATETEPAEGTGLYRDRVYEDDTLFMMHMDGSHTVQIDSTGNYSPIMGAGWVSGDVEAGKVGNRLRSDATTTKTITLSDSASILATLPNSSLFFWFNTSTGTDSAGEGIYSERSGSNAIWKAEVIDPGNAGPDLLGFTHRNDATTLNQSNGSTEIDDGTDRFAHYTKTGTALDVYLNGSGTAEFSDTLSDDSVSVEEVVLFGDGFSSTSRFAGALEEVRGMGKATSKEWGQTHYNAQNSNGTFWSAGSWQASGGQTADASPLAYTLTTVDPTATVAWTADASPLTYTLTTVDPAGVWTEEAVSLSLAYTLSVLAPAGVWSDDGTLLPLAYTLVTIDPTGEMSGTADASPLTYTLTTVDPAGEVGTDVTIASLVYSLGISAATPSISQIANASPLAYTLTTVDPTATVAWTADASPLTYTLTVGDIDFGAFAGVVPLSAALSVVVPTGEMSGTANASPLAYTLTTVDPTAIVAWTADASPLTYTLTVVDPTATVAWTADASPLVYTLTTLAPTPFQGPDAAPAPITVNLTAVSPTGVLTVSATVAPLGYSLTIVSPSPTDPVEDSPASVIRQWLLNQLLGVDYESNQVSDWPVFLNHMPDVDGVSDQALAVYDTGAVADGRHHTDGETVEHPTVQIRARGTTADEAYTRIRNIASRLDSVQNTNVVVSSTKTIINASRGQILSLGQESDVRRRVSYVMNVTTTIKSG